MYRLTEASLRRIIRTTILNEWKPTKEGDRPPSFRLPVEGKGIKVQFADVEYPHEDVPTRRKVVARIVTTGDGYGDDEGKVVVEGKQVLYDSNHSGDKMARIAYEQALREAAKAYEDKYKLERGKFYTHFKSS